MAEFGRQQTSDGHAECGGRRLVGRAGGFDSDGFADSRPEPACGNIAASCGSGSDYTDGIHAGR